MKQSVLTLPRQLNKSYLFSPLHLSGTPNLKYLITGVIVLVFLTVNTTFAQQNDTTIHDDTKSSPKNAAIRPIDLYQKHLSPILGGKCPMYPSCSQYSKEAINQHGIVLGWFMTCDRLVRCGRDELNRSERVKVNQHNRCYDPVSKNDFWLK